jgi:hypothetical protein
MSIPEENTQYWIEKYKPTKISDIVCNRKAVGIICNWLSSYKKNRSIALKNRQNNFKRKRSKMSAEKELDPYFYSCMVVTGDHGVGKTVSTETILKEYNYEIHGIDFNAIKINKNFKENINKMMCSRNVLNVMKKKNAKKIAIIVDELESITSTTEKNCLITLQKMNDIEWYCPIIFISNNKHNKLLTDIKKSSLKVKFYFPFPFNLRKIFIKIIKNEEMRIKSESVVNMILEHSQSDIRRLIFMLEDINDTYNNQVITVNTINEYCSISKKKDVDIDLYRATEGLLYKYSNINNCLRYYETEKVLLPLMVHHNYLKSIMNGINNTNKREYFEVINNVSMALSDGDVIENYIYGDQNWDMQEVHGSFTCAVTSYYLSKIINNNQPKVSFDFTTDLNKTSIKKINKKNINNTNKCFKNMNISDYIYINKIIRKMISEGNIEECVDILCGYDIRLEHIESLLKIDKIINTKTTLTSKQRKTFSKFLEEKKSNNDDYKNIKSLNK